MRGYQEGDEEAFRALFERYEGRLYNFFLRRLEDTEAAADAYQKVWLKVHRARERFEPAASFRTWVFTIAYNTLKDEFKARTASREVAMETLPEVPEGRPALESPLEQEELRRSVRQALADLSDGQREIILLSKFEGLSYPEIAVVTGLSVNAVKQKAHRAFLNLKDALKARLEAEGTSP